MEPNPTSPSHQLPGAEKPPPSMRVLWYFVVAGFMALFLISIGMQPSMANYAEVVIGDEGLAEAITVSNTQDGLHSTRATKGDPSPQFFGSRIHNTDQHDGKAGTLFRFVWMSFACATSGNGPLYYKIDPPLPDDIKAHYDCDRTGTIRIIGGYSGPRYTGEHTMIVTDSDGDTDTMNLVFQDIFAPAETSEQAPTTTNLYRATNQTLIERHYFESIWNNNEQLNQEYLAPSSSGQGFVDGQLEDSLDNRIINTRITPPHYEILYKDIPTGAILRVDTTSGDGSELSHQVTPDLPAGLSFVYGPFATQYTETTDPDYGWYLTGTPTETSPLTRYILTFKDGDGDIANTYFALKVEEYQGVYFTDPVVVESTESLVGSTTFRPGTPINIRLPQTAGDPEGVEYGFDGLLPTGLTYASNRINGTIAEDWLDDLPDWQDNVVGSEWTSSMSVRDGVGSYNLRYTARKGSSRATINFVIKVEPDYEVGFEPVIKEHPWHNGWDPKLSEYFNEQTTQRYVTADSTLVQGKGNLRKFPNIVGNYPLTLSIEPALPVGLSLHSRSHHEEEVKVITPTFVENTNLEGSESYVVNLDEHFIGQNEYQPFPYTYAHFLLGSPQKLQDTTQYTLTVTDRDGDIGTYNFNLNVVQNSAPTFDSQIEDLNIQVGDMVNVTFPGYSGGNGVINEFSTSNRFTRGDSSEIYPAGLEIQESDGQRSLVGTVTAPTKASYTYAHFIVDLDGDYDIMEYSINVTENPEMTPSSEKPTSTTTTTTPETKFSPYQPETTIVKDRIVFDYVTGSEIDLVFDALTGIPREDEDWRGQGYDWEVGFDGDTPYNPSTYRGTHGTYIGDDSDWTIFGTVSADNLCHTPCSSNSNVINLYPPMQLETKSFEFVWWAQNRDLRIEQPITLNIIRNKTPSFVGLNRELTTLEHRFGSKAHYAELVYAVGEQIPELRLPLGTGGNGSLQYELIGQLPDGLTLRSNVISGTPQTAYQHNPQTLIWRLLDSDNDRYEHDSAWLYLHLTVLEDPDDYPIIPLSSRLSNNSTSAAGPSSFGEPLVIDLDQTAQDPLPAEDESDTDTTIFLDIGGNAHQKNIQQLANQGITSGCQPNHFCPDRSVTRGEVASLLVRALGLPSVGEDFFADDQGSTHQQNINRLVAAGLTSGCRADSFCPDRSVTRGEVASLLVRALGLPSAGVDFFADDQGSTHQQNINRLAAAGLTSGCRADSFCPDRQLTRAEVATLLTRALQLISST